MLGLGRRRVGAAGALPDPLLIPALIAHMLCHPRLLQAPGYFYPAGGKGESLGMQGLCGGGLLRRCCPAGRSPHQLPPLHTAALLPLPTPTRRRVGQPPVLDCGHVHDPFERHAGMHIVASFRQLSLFALQQARWRTGCQQTSSAGRPSVGLAH